MRDYFYFSFFNSSAAFEYEIFRPAVLFALLLLPMKFNANIAKCLRLNGSS